LPDLHFSGFGRPAEQVLKGQEIDTVRCVDALPHVAERQTRRGYMREQRVKAEPAGRIGLEVAKLVDAPDVDAAFLILGERPRDASVRQPDQAPRHAVVFEDADVVTDVHDPAVVLDDRPVLYVGAVFPWEVVADGWQPVLAFRLSKNRRKKHGKE